MPSLKSVHYMVPDGISFFVVGVPATKGSWKPVRKRGGKVHLRPDNPKEATWHDAVAWAARVWMKGRPPMEGAISVTMTFEMPRPATSTHGYPTVGDVDKMARSVLDSLSKIVYPDDRHVIEIRATKNYVEPGGTPGCSMHVVQVSR